MCILYGEYGPPPPGRRPHSLSRLFAAVMNGAIQISAVPQTRSAAGLCDTCSPRKEWACRTVYAGHRGRTAGSRGPSRNAGAGERVGKVLSDPRIRASE